MTCPYEIESGCEFAEEVLTADAAQTTRTYFEQQQLQQDFAEVQELLVQLSPKQEELIELHFWKAGATANWHRGLASVLRRSAKRSKRTY